LHTRMRASMRAGGREISNPASWSAMWALDGIGTAACTYSWTATSCGRLPATTHGWRPRHGQQAEPGRPWHGGSRRKKLTTRLKLENQLAGTLLSFLLFRIDTERYPRLRFTIVFPVNGSDGHCHSCYIFSFRFYMLLAYSG
jgi:hypothetical protein